MKVEYKPQKVNVTVGGANLGIGFGNPIARDYVDRDPYEGPYEVTPGAEAVVLETYNLRMTGNVTVNPIPSNYGLITWNGSVLTVS